MKGAMLVILGALLIVQSGVCSPSLSCSHPPIKWCSSLEVAVQCGVSIATCSNLYLLSYKTL